MQASTNNGCGARISAIIPARNEERSLEDCLRALSGAGLAEIIVADGGSRDRTCEVAERHGATIVFAEAGRARQMNAAAAMARGEYLLCVHADTIVPAGFARAVGETLANEQVALGAFTLRIASDRPPFRWIERLVDWRSRYLDLPYGDQALFFRRAAFEAVGGYPDLAVMEDYELVRRLRRHGRVVVVPEVVVTSARRWLERGVLRTTALNQVCLFGHLLGVPAKHLARWRG
ncbi:MAG: TIGR04283 family arsenosugar biosynthesis glycosyltransferase [Planctomycetota bacterium]